MCATVQEQAPPHLQGVVEGGGVNIFIQQHSLITEEMSAADVGSLDDYTT